MTLTPVVLQNNTLRLTVLPELGACIAGLELRRGDFWLPIMRPMSAAAAAQRMSADSSSYILAPYSNRIRGGRFAFGGEEFQLEPNWADGKMTIHGEVHNRAWQIVEQSAERLVCRFEAAAGLNYPFAYAVEAGFGVSGPRVQLDLEMKNTNPRPMPAGLGHHPYFMRSLGIGGEAALQFKAEKVYITDSSCIPAEPAVAIPRELDFSQARAVGSTFLDNVFAGWDGQLTLAGNGFSMRMTADPVFSHLVVFTPPDGTVALEPVTHATDGFNLMGKAGFGDVGVKILEPNQTLKGSVQIELNETH